MIRHPHKNVLFKSSHIPILHTYPKSIYKHFIRSGNPSNYDLATQKIFFLTESNTHNLDLPKKHIRAFLWSINLQIYGLATPPNLFCFCLNQVQYTYSLPTQNAYTSNFYDLATLKFMNWQPHKKKLFEPSPIPIFLTYPKSIYKHFLQSGNHRIYDPATPTKNVFAYIKSHTHTPYLPKKHIQAFYIICQLLKSWSGNPKKHFFRVFSFFFVWTKSNAHNFDLPKKQIQAFFMIGQPSNLWSGNPPTNFFF